MWNPRLDPRRPVGGGVTLAEQFADLLRASGRRTLAVGIDGALTLDEADRLASQVGLGGLHLSIEPNEAIDVALPPGA